LPPQYLRMNSVKIQYIAGIVFLCSVCGNLSAQERDFFKQIINESLKKDFRLDILSLSPLSDSLSIIRSINQLRFDPSYTYLPNDSIVRAQKSLARLFAPYTNPKYNPTRSKLMDYQHLMPKVTYDHLSGAGFVSLTAVAAAAIYLLKPQKETVLSIQFSKSKFSEFEKKAITERTNQLIWDALYGDWFNTENDSTNTHGR
jgi:hypothetical protein